MDVTDHQQAATAFQALSARLNLAPKKVISLSWRWAAAAAILIVLGAGGWWLQQSRLHPEAATPVLAGKTEVPAPVINRATITLANGQQVFLDSAANGSLAEQGNARVVKLADGAVAYQRGTTEIGASAVLYNTLSNPRGSRIINLALSDGTQVWLNAESSLKYPAVFAGSDRRVEITGEAYFEVTKTPHAPFIVKKGNAEVQVLGTHFNVNAYDNEADLKVTLLEGKVQVKQGEKTVLLAPGEQAVLDHVTGSLSKGVNIDVEQVMAWKNGLFSFAGADLPTVMRQLGRWYDVDVRYEGTIPARRFRGKISKTLTLDQVLQTLAQTRVHYSIDNRHHLTIRP